MLVHLKFLRRNIVYVFHRVTSSVKSTCAPASEPSYHVMTSQRTARVCVVTSDVRVLERVAWRMKVTSSSGACTATMAPRHDRHATRMLGSEINISVKQSYITATHSDSNSF